MTSPASNAGPSLCAPLDFVWARLSVSCRWLASYPCDHALATGKDLWSELSLCISTTSPKSPSWHSKPLIYTDQWCLAESSLRDNVVNYVCRDRADHLWQFGMRSKPACRPRRTAVRGCMLVDTRKPGRPTCGLRKTCRSVG